MFSSRSQGSTAAPASLVLPAATLAFFAFAFTIWIIWRSFIPLEIDDREIWNAWNADAIFSGRPLYPSLTALNINNYPPLSYYAVAWLSTITGNTVVAGRVLSDFSLIVTSLIIFLSARHFRASLWSSLIGAFWYLATISHFYTDFAGMNDPSLLTLAIMSIGFFIFIRSEKATSTIIAFLILIAGGFVKHILIATPVFCLIWLYMKDKKLAYVCILISAIAIALGLLLCYRLYGAVFFEQLTFQRETSLIRPFTRIGRLQWVALAMIFYAVWARSRPDLETVKLTKLFIITGFVTNFLAQFGNGVANNSQFELLFAVGLGLSLAFDDLAKMTWRTRYWKVNWAHFASICLVLRLLAGGPQDPYFLLFDASYREKYARETAAVLSEAERVRQLPGPVSCSIRTVCYLAGKGFVYDDWAMGQRVATGAASQEQIDAEVKRQGIRFEQVDGRAEWHPILLFCGRKCRS